LRLERTKLGKEPDPVSARPVKRAMLRITHRELNLEVCIQSGVGDCKFGVWCGELCGNKSREGKIQSQ